MRVLSSPCCSYGFLAVMVSSVPRQREEVSAEDLRIMRAATGPRLTFRRGNNSGLANFVGLQRALSASENTKPAPSDRVNLGEDICTIVFYCSFYHVVNTAVWRGVGELCFYGESEKRVEIASFCLWNNYFVRVWHFCFKF